LLTLSVRQPYAWLIVNGFKKVEYRSWKPKCETSTRILIHAGKTVDREAMQKFRKIAPSALMLKGGVVGSVIIASIRFRNGGFEWKLAEAELLPFYRCDGRLGLFHLEGF